MNKIQLIKNIVRITIITYIILLDLINALSLFMYNNDDIRKEKYCDHSIAWFLILSWFITILTSLYVLLFRYEQNNNDTKYDIFLLTYHCLLNIVIIIQFFKELISPCSTVLVNKYNLIIISFIFNIIFTLYTTIIFIKRLIVIISNEFNEIQRINELDPITQFIKNERDQYRLPIYTIDSYDSYSNEI